MLSQHSQASQHPHSKMPRIIAICGAKRSGKDVLAEHLVSKYNYERVSFAEPLKHAIKTLFNFDDDQVGIGEDKGTGKKDIVDERWGITPRAALQFFGTEVMQEKIQDLLPDIKRNFFANTLKNYIKTRMDANEGQRFVISDLRFIHEYEMLFSIPKIHKDDIAIIRVIRPDTSFLRISNPCDAVAAAAASVASIAHKSEQEYINIPYDIILFNNDTIEAYIEKFDKIISV
jgi:hypothetical protein